MSTAEGERKEQQRQYVERLIESDLSVSEWCTRYGIVKQSMYAWLKRFAETEPELFGGKDNIVDSSKRRWVETTRSKVKSSRALALRRAPGVVIVDTLYGEPSRELRDKPAAANGISIELKGISVHIPPGSAKADISCVLNL